MDSIKSIVVVAILLGVLYGIYQVINDEDSPVSPKSSNLMAEFDDSSLADSAAGNKNQNTNPDNDASAAGKLTNVDPAKENSPVTVTPPPSNFKPEPSKFAFPKSENEGFDETANQIRPSKKRDSGQNSGFMTPVSQPVVQPKSSTASSDLAAQNSFGQFQPAKTNTGQPFKEINQGQIENKSALVANPPEEVPNFDNSRNVPAAAEADINDPSRRFVQGSFVDFEKQVLGDMERAEQLIRENEFLKALKLLTKFYDDPRLTREENQNLASWLDPLAGKVIYSEEHHLEETYFVRPNDTLNLLSVKYHVPAELIYNINRNVITDPQKLVPGTELKMVKGPFNAEISLSKKQMTLFVQGMYAGTFKIRIGTEPVPKLGKYRLLSKSRLGQDYSDQNYQRIAASAPNNPYGKHYLNIGGGMAIHGSAQVSDSNDRRGCISLNAVDAEDVHNILTTESTIAIVK